MKIIFWRLAAIVCLMVLPEAGIGGNLTANDFLYKPDLGARGPVEKEKFEAGLDRIDARLGKEIWVGDPNYGTTLQEAVAAIDTDSVILRVPAGSHSISADLTIPATLALRLERGAVLAVATGKTLTINGPLEAGRYQIFSLTGTAKVSQANPAAYPEWFGFAASASAAVNAAALQAAIDSLSAGGKVSLAAGSYSVTTGVIDLGLGPVGAPVRGGNLTLEGAAPVGYGGLTNNTTILVADGSGVLIDATTMRGGGVKNLTLDGNDTAGICLNVLGAMGCRFERLILKRAADVGLWVQSALNNGVYGSTFAQIYATACGGPGFYFKAHSAGYINCDVFQELTASGCGLTGAGASGLQYGMVFDTIYNSVIQTSTAENNLYDHGLYITGCQNIEVDGGLYEGNGISNGTPANCYQIYVAGTYHVIVSPAARVNATGGTKGIYSPDAVGNQVWGWFGYCQDYPSPWTNGRMSSVMRNGGLLINDNSAAKEILGTRLNTKTWPGWVVLPTGEHKWRYTDADTPDGGNLKSIAAGTLGTDNCFLATEGFLHKRALVASSGGVLTLPDTGCFYAVTLTENITSIVMPTIRDGKVIRLQFFQAASGGPYTVGGWPATVKLAGGAFTMTSTADKSDLLTFIYNLGKTKWYEVSRSQNM